MTALSAAYFAAALLLCAAGVTKVWRPGPTRRAAEGQGLSVPDWSVRLFGLAEIALGASVIAAGGSIVASLQALLYLAFAIFVVRGLRRGDLTSCGCFGASDRPPTWTHAMVNAVLAAASGWSAVAGADPLLAEDMLVTTVGWLAVVMVVVDAVLVYLVLARLAGETA